jgi:endonuclease/exonuclease/phosphatase family metal-dependent hydrolase
MLIKVMTFNIRGARTSIEDGINAWKNRRKLNISTIQKYAPDILGFQEAQKGNVEAYAKAFPDYNSFQGFAAARQFNNDEYNPIYWNASRFREVERGQFYLSLTPQKKSIGWESSLERVATWLKLRDIASDTVFFVLNTHFPHEGGLHETRQHCAKLIIEEANAIAGDLPVVLMGDFNAYPDSKAYQTFLEAGFRDSYLDTRTERIHTFHGFVGENHTKLGERIDWVLTKRFSTLEYQVIRDAEPPIFPSDHYPVLANLETL